MYPRSRHEFHGDFRALISYNFEMMLHKCKVLTEGGISFVYCRKRMSIVEVEIADVAIRMSIVFGSAFMFVL